MVEHSTYNPEIEGSDPATVTGKQKLAKIWQIVGCTQHLYYKNITIVNDTSRVVRMTPQLEASLTIIILITLEVLLMLLESSIMLLENIFNTGLTHHDCHLLLSYLYSTGHL